MTQIIATTAEDLALRHSEEELEQEALLVTESIDHLHRCGMEGTNTCAHLLRRLQALHEALLLLR